jgi:hypothetical protein
VKLPLKIWQGKVKSYNLREEEFTEGTYRVVQVTSDKMLIEKEGTDALGGVTWTMTDDVVRADHPVLFCAWLGLFVQPPH